MKLTAEHITKEYLRENRADGSNRFFAVQDTTLTLESGTMTVLMGRSGSGKSTLLNMLAGLSVPSSGTVKLDGTDLYAMPDQALSRLRNEKIGVIPQGQTALHSLTVKENILLPYLLYGDQPDSDFAEQLMQTLDIAALADAKPAELSGGEMRRTAIARALIRKPMLVLADEPTADLDDENTAAVFRLLLETARQGAAVFIVTHENDAAQYADRMLKMSGGVITDIAAQ